MRLISKCLIMFYRVISLFSLLIHSLIFYGLGLLQVVTFANHFQDVDEKEKLGTIK